MFVMIIHPSNPLLLAPPPPASIHNFSAIHNRYIRVALVTPRGAAAVAGLRVGDVILSCNGVGLLGATLSDAEAALGESATAKLQVAECTLPVPDFQRRGSERFAHGYGAMTASLAIRPLYCEVELRRLPEGGKGSVAFGLSINTRGPDPIVESVCDVQLLCCAWYQSECVKTTNERNRRSRK